MKDNEKYYEEVKERIIFLQNNKIITELQCDYLLYLARKELGLLVVNKSIYL